MQSSYFDEDSATCPYPTVPPSSKLLAQDCGFLVNGALTIFVELVALEVTSTSGESDNFKPLSIIENKDGVKSIDLLNKTQELKESIDVNGFQALPS